MKEKGVKTLSMVLNREHEEKIITKKKQKKTGLPNDVSVLSTLSHPIRSKWNFLAKLASFTG